MTIKELTEKLKQFPENSEVCIRFHNDKITGICNEPFKIEHGGFYTIEHHLIGEVYKGDSKKGKDKQKRVYLELGEE